MMQGPINLRLVKENLMSTFYMPVFVTQDSYFAMDERMTVKQMNKMNKKKKIMMIRRIKC